MIGLQQFAPRLSEVPAFDPQGGEFSNILSYGTSGGSRRLWSKANAKAVSFVLITTEKHQLAKVAWKDLGDDSGVAKMALEIKNKEQEWQTASQWTASRSASEQSYEIPANQVSYTNEWKMWFLSTHGADQMIVDYVKFFEVVLPVEEEPDDSDDDENHFCLVINKKMWNDKKFTDVCLTCNGETVNAHRCILAAASPVFSTMLETGMKEAQSQEILIEDADSAGAVKAMVEFMYTGELDCVDIGGVDSARLLVFGHRYAIAGLVTEAADTLMDNLTPDNICDIVRMLRPYQDDPLLKSVFLLLMKAIHVDSQLLHCLVTAV